MASFIDRQGRILGKVSAVDVLIVLLVAALIVFAFARFSKPAAQAVPVRITLTVEKVRDPTVSVFKQGAPVYDEGGALLGHVKEVTASRMPLDVYTADGRQVAGATSQVYWDLKIVVEGQGHVSASSISVGGVPLRVGKPLVIIGPGFEVKTQIQGVEVVQG